MSGGWTLSRDEGREWPSLDPYSHWLLSHGSKFVPHDRRKAKTAPIMGVINRYTLSSHTKGGDFLSGVVNTPAAATLDNPLVSADDFRKISKRRIRGNPKRTTQLIFRLPMRPESLPAEALPNGQRVAPKNWELRFDPEAQSPVIVVVIDDFMNVADDRLCDDMGKTRVEFAWVQDADAVETEQKSAVPFGREWLGKDVDGLRDIHGRRSDQLLSALGLRSFAKPLGAPLDRRYSHGSHILDLAGSSEPKSADANGLRLIAVMLPQASTRESSGALLGFYVLTGLQYALKRARIIQAEIGKPVPVIVNFSYGITGGPHDGTHIVEELMQTAIDQETDSNMPVTLVMPAGNNRLDRGHAVAIAQTDQDCVLDLPWRIQPCDSTPNYLEVWIPPHASWSKLQITLPDGTVLKADGLAAHRAFLIKDQREKVIARISLDQPQGQSGKHRLMFAMIPTATTLNRQKRRSAQAGVWQVKVLANLEIGERMDAWIQRDVWPLRENAETRQSYFDDPSYERFSKNGKIMENDPATNLSIVRRSGTLNGLTTARPPVAAAPVVVGATIGSSKKQANYSALSDGDMIGGKLGAKPVLMSSERQRTARGVLAAGSRNGSVVALGGTSVAAPQITSVLADAIMSGKLAVGADAHEWLASEIAKHGGILPAKGRQSRV
jgi:hypothetical protein